MARGSPHCLCSVRRPGTWRTDRPCDATVVGGPLRIGCPAWIRTKTNSSKGSCATITPPDNPRPEYDRAANGAKEILLAWGGARLRGPGLAFDAMAGWGYENDLFMKFSSRTVLVVLTAVHMGAGGMAGFAAQRGDKIEFSRPTSPSSVKPMTEQDLGPRGFSFQRRQGNATDDLAAPPPLPAPDQVNQMRVLQMMIERAAVRSGASLGEDDNSIEATLRSRNLDASINIDDLFEPRPGERRGRNGQPGSALDRDSGDGRGFEDGRWRSGDDPVNGRNRDRPGTEPRRSDNDTTPFLPGLDPRAGERTGYLEGSRPNRGDNFLRTMTGGRGPGEGREGDDARARDERMESFRRMLRGGGISSERGGGSGGGSGSGLFPGGGGGAVSAPGLLGAPGTGLAPGNSGRNGGLEGVNGLPGPAESPGTLPTLVGDGLGGRGAVSLPSRPMDFEQRSIRQGGRGSGSDRSDPPPPRPMELFQQKHDTRIPSRVF